MNHCGNRKDTWINDEIKKAYLQLHLDGGAHSLEVWCDGKIAGGLYGVSVGSAFFAEVKIPHHNRCLKSGTILFSGTYE